MERLTFIDQHGWYAVDNSGERVRGPHVDRLAALEDILNGYDIDRLPELAQAEVEQYFCLGKRNVCDHPHRCDECDHSDGSGGINVNELHRILNEVALTPGEAESLADFLESYLIQIIHNDASIDNIEWLCNLCSVYQKCKNTLTDRKEQ